MGGVFEEIVIRLSITIQLFLYVVVYRPGMAIADWLVYYFITQLKIVFGIPLFIYFIIDSMFMLSMFIGSMIFVMIAFMIVAFWLAIIVGILSIIIGIVRDWFIMPIYWIFMYGLDALDSWLIA